MACLDVTISRIGGLQAVLRKLGGIVVEVNDVAKDGHLVARFGVICTVEAVNDYLNVTPADIQWITDDIGVFYNVEANVNWIVE